MLNDIIIYGIGGLLCSYGFVNGIWCLFKPEHWAKSDWSFSTLYDRESVEELEGGGSQFRVQGIMFLLVTLYGVSFMIGNPLWISICHLILVVTLVGLFVVFAIKALIRPDIPVTSSRMRPAFLRNRTFIRVFVLLSLVLILGSLFLFSGK